MKAVVQHFIGTTEEWETENPILYKAVWGFEETADGRIFAKLGNGLDRWKSLKYFDTANVKGLPEKIQELMNAVSEEIQQRQQADSTLLNNINVDYIKPLFLSTISSAHQGSMVKGAGRDLMQVLLGINFADLATQSEINTAIRQVMAEIRRRCNNNGEIDASGIPDFGGLFIGDYLDGMDLSGVEEPNGGSAPQAWNNTYKNNRIVIAGFNFYKDSGDIASAKNHIVFAFNNAIATGRINPTDNNTGGYIASEIRQWLESAIGDGSGPFAVGLKHAIGDYLYTIRKLDANGVPVWSSYTVFLPTEIEVYGHTIRGLDTLPDGSRSVMPPIQLPIYQKSTECIIKKRNGGRISWWLSSAYAANTANWCYVALQGTANINRVSSVYGLSPLFCIV